MKDLPHWRPTIIQFKRSPTMGNLVASTASLLCVLKIKENIYIQNIYILKSDAHQNYERLTSSTPSPNSAQMQSRNGQPRHLLDCLALVCAEN